MDFTDTAEEKEFGGEAREFIAANLAPAVARRFKRGWRWTRAETEDWTRRLHAKGWSAPNWPVEYGGTGWTPMQRHIFESEVWMAGAPPTHNQNFDLVGPIVYSFGNDEQKRRFLPPILSVDYYWAQGFSEPGAGSDLASLKTRAVRDGDCYIVDGQKTWTTDAEVCDGVFTLVRTSQEAVKPQAAISFLLIDLKLPGVTIRPIELMNGERHLNEVFFDAVRVPAENLVGEVEGLCCGVLHVSCVRKCSADGKATCENADFHVLSGLDQNLRSAATKAASVDMDNFRIV